MTNDPFAPIPSEEQEIREGIGTGVAFILMYGIHLLLLSHTFERPTLILFTILTLALAGVYVISGVLHLNQRLSSLGKMALLPVFLLGNALMLAIALTLWGQGQFYFCLVLLNGYGAFVYYRDDRRLSVVFSGGMIALSLLAYFLFWGQPQAFPAWLRDLPWYGLVIALAEITSRQREHREKVQTLATELSEAHQRLTEYATQVEELAVTRERARLASEIHDSVGHALTALDVQMELLVRTPFEQGDQRQRLAEAARDLVKTGLTDLRRAVQALRPAALETFSLPEAIEGLVTEFRKMTNADIRCQVNGEIVSLSAQSALVLYRAAQEALTNIQRHAAQATQVYIELDFMSHSVSLSVQNNGLDQHGPDLTGGTGLGLHGIRERATAMGGTLQANPDDEGNFIIKVHLPII